MKKYFFAFFGLLFFFNVSSCYAEEVYFNMSKDKEGILFNALCSGESGGSCHYYCKNKKEKLLGTVNDAIVKCQNEGAGDGYDSIAKFSNPNLKNVSDVSKFLNGYTNCRATGDSKNNNCRNYVINNYCGKSNNEEVCKELNKIKDAGVDQTTDKKGNTTALKCSITIKSGKSTDDDTLHNLNVMAYITKSSAELYKGSLDEKYGYTVTSNKISNSNTIVHFYPINSTYKSFSKEVANKTFDVENGPKCPTLNFCLQSLELSETNGKYVWWTELGECDTSIYSNVSQTSGSDGSNSGTKLLKEEPKWSLISGKINFSSCQELLGKDSSELVDLLKSIVTIIKISIPLILVSLGTLDFGKAILSSNEDLMKKSQQKFIQRVIIAVVIFLIPSILKALLTLASSIWGNISADLCGIL